MFHVEHNIKAKNKKMFHVEQITIDIFKNCDIIKISHHTEVKNNENNCNRKPKGWSR